MHNKSFEYARKLRGQDALKARASQFERYVPRAIEA